MEDIETGLVALVKEIRKRNIRSIAIPPLGSGLGGLEWSEVRTRIQKALANLDGVEVIVFNPDSRLTDKRINRSTDVPKMTPGHAAIVGLMDHYLRVLLDPFVTLLEVHKLMYFMQAEGEPLRLRFSKASYGPYAENLRHVLHRIEGHLISGYADSDGDTPGKKLELVPGAVEDAGAFLKKHQETRQRFKKVVDLVEGFESSFGLELLSTVHWVVNEEQAQTMDDIIRRTYFWNPQKQKFSQRQIKLAAQVLADKGWIDRPKP